MGTQTVAQAAEVTKEQIDKADIYTDTVLDESNQISLTGSWIYYSNEQGSPDPIIVNNGDNTYNIVMYDDTEILIETTDTARYYDDWGDGTIRYYKYYMDDLTPWVLGDDYYEEVKTEDGEVYGWVHDRSQDVVDFYDGSGISKNRKDLESLMNVYNSAECPLSVIYLKGLAVGSVSMDIRYQDDIYKQYGDNMFIKNCGITLNITVLPAQAGAQTPVYSDSQLDSIKAKEDAAAYAEWKRENADATWIRWTSWY